MVEIIQFVPRPKPTESNIIEMGPMIDLSKLQEFDRDWPPPLWIIGPYWGIGQYTNLPHHDWPDEQPDDDEEPC